MSEYNNGMVQVELYDLKDNSFSVKLTNMNENFSFDEIKMENRNGFLVCLDISRIDDFARRCTINRKDVMISIVEEYKKTYGDLRKHKAKKENKKAMNPKIHVKFLETDILNGKYTVAISKEGEETISGITVVYKYENMVNVNFPFDNSQYPWKSVNKKAANKAIIEAVVKNFYPSTDQDEVSSVSRVKEKEKNCIDMSVKYYDEQPELGLCMAEIFIGNDYHVKDIRVVNSVSGEANVRIEDAVSLWECPDITIKEARKLIIEDFKVHAAENNYQNYKKLKRDARSKNEVGRILNAENAGFRYYPNTLIRKKTPKKGVVGRWGTLISEMSSENPLISSFEIDVLSWINTLRYMTKTMILDLYTSGYLSKSWRNINSDSLGKVITQLEKYLLLTVNQFVSFGSDVSDIESKPMFEIYTLGGNGSRLLREIGRPARYNMFDTVQDGNVVKRLLSANQWLIFMLKKYNKVIDNGYIANKKIYLMSSESSGARVYGGVNLGDRYIVAEPLRRTDPAIAENDENETLDKLWRFIKIFNDLDNVYTNDWQKMEFPSRPIICFVCEDYEHIWHLISVVNRVIKDNPQQKIWFTTDLNIFNEVVDGSRFFELSGDDLIDVEI